jgi:hypothetical protein
MSSLDAWLAAMPPEHEIDERIGHAEAELHKLQLVKQLHQERGATRSSSSHANGERRNSNGNGHMQLLAAEPNAEVNPARLSRERREILKAMLSLSKTEVPTRLVAHRLRLHGHQADDRHVGQNMARMEKAGLLRRVRHGTYSVPPDVAEFVRQEGESRDHGVMR